MRKGSLRAIRNPGKLLKLAVLIGGIGVVSALGACILSYYDTIAIAERSARGLFMRQARLIAKAIEISPTKTQQDLLGYIATLWKTQAGAPVRAYLCVFGKDGRILLHTARPGAKGLYVGNRPLPDSPNPTVKTLQDLTDKYLAYAGEFVAMDGQRQIAVFVPVPSKGWILGIHRSKASFVKEVRRNISPLLIGFLLIVFTLFPVSLLILSLSASKLLVKNGVLEELLHHKERTLESILNASTETIILFDRNGEVKYANNTLAERLGKTKQDILGKRLTDLLPPDTAKIRSEKIQQVIHSGHPIRFEDTRSGRTFDNHIVPVLDADGRPTGVVVFARDVTNERSKENELRENEQYFRSLLDNMHEDILVIDREFRITDANARFLVSTGYDRKAVIGRHCYEISHGYHESCEVHGRECKVKEVFETGKPCNILHEHVNVDGSLTWHDGLLSPIFDENGQVTHVIQAMRDVTDLMEIRTRLEESEKHYRDLFNNVTEAIFIYDVSGRILEVNQVACKKLGYTHDEFLTMTMSDIHAEGYSYCTPERIERLSENEHKIFESCHVAKDGTTIPVELSCRLIEYQDGPAVLSVARDISERKQAEKEKEKLEKELRQAQKMEAIGTLAGGIAHDFNNILGAVIGLSELALLDIEEGTTLHSHISQILKAGLRARDLVQQILAFSRQKEQERMRISIVPLVKESLKLLRSSLPSTIQIETHIDPEPGIIEGDPTQIQQVLMNLCSNAEHAMREKGGILEIGIYRVEVGKTKDLPKIHPSLSPGSYVCLTVRDTGHGMDEKTMAKIFDPYFTTKEVGEGTGLGLAVVQGIVEKHGGVITAESEVNEGTTFKVYFPIVEGKEDSIIDDRKIQGPAPTGNEKILFVDDEQALAEVGRGILESLGYEVTVRTSGLEALQLFKAKPNYFDLVITDMSMPNMTGEQLSRELIKIRPDIPIILCTGFSHIISKEKAHAIGIKAFAMKPLLRKDLAETVRRVLDDTRASNQ